MTQVSRHHDYLLANYPSLQWEAQNLLACPTPLISAELQPMKPKVVAHQLRIGLVEVAALDLR